MPLLDAAGAGNDPMTLAITALGLGAMLLVLAWGGASGRLRRNAVAGIRLNATLSTDVAWRAGHHAAALWLGIGGAVAVLFGLGALGLVVSGSPAVGRVLGWLGIAAAVVPLVPAAVVAERAASATRRSRR